MKFAIDVKLESIVGITSMIFCFMLLTLDIAFIIKSSSHRIKSDLLLFVAIISVICCIFTNSYMAFGSNNSIYMNKNSLILSTLMNHCDIGFRLCTVSMILSVYLFIIFILRQIINVSHHLPLKYQIKSKSYTLLTIILCVIPFFLCLYLMYDRQAISIGIVETADNKYKYCYFSISSRNYIHRFVLVSISSVAVTATCIFFGGFVLYKRINNILSDKNILNLNKKEIKKISYDIVTLTILLIIYVVANRLLKQYFPSSYRITLVPQIMSFTISMFITSNLYRNYKHAMYEINQIKLMNQHIPIIQMHNIIKTHSNSVVTNSVSLTAASNSCDLVYKYQNSFQLMVADKYIKDAMRIFSILNNLKYMNEVGTVFYHILQEIAAFAATQYEPCIDCATDLPLVECDKDFHVEFGVLSMLDEYQNIRYYINQHNDSIELLCQFCAIKHGVLPNFLLFPTIHRTFETLRNETQ
eukprot:11790_1